MLLLIAGLVLFLGLHSLRIVSPGLRPRLIGRLGENGWRVLYSAASLATLAVLVWGFAEARAETPVLWYPPLWTHHITATLMLAAMICLVASALPAGYIRQKLKFPLIVAVKIWALAHLIANGELSSILLFTAFLGWAVVLRIALKKAVARGALAYPVFVSARYDAIALIAGVALWVWMIFGLHEWLIGVPPLVF